MITEENKMKNKLLVVFSLVFTFCLAFALLTGCGPKQPEEEVGETEVVYTEKTNPYSKLTWEQYGTFGTPSFNDVATPVLYQFEGSYSEAYQGDYSREYLYINCYRDGLLYGTLGGSGIYGYWTNRDNRDREQFVLHILRHGNAEYNQGVYDMLAEKVEDPDDYYEYSSSFIWNRGWGIRSVLIFGYKYTSVTEMTVDASEAKTEYLMGDKLNTDGLKVTIKRENGKTTRLDNLSSVNGVKFLGFDPNTESDANTVYVRYRDAVATYAVKVVAPVYKGKLIYDGKDVDGTVKITSSDACTVTFGGNTAKAKYSKSTIAGDVVYTLSAPGEDDEFELGVSEDIWNKLNKRTILNIDEETGDFTLAPFRKIMYTIPWDNYPGYSGNVRNDFEVLSKGAPGGGTTYRYIFLDPTKGEATLTYKYWYDANTDTFVMKYTLENGILTFTELVNATVGASRASYNNLYKEYRIIDDTYAIGTHVKLS